MRDRAIAVDGGVCAALKVRDLLIGQCGQVLNQLDVYVRETIMVLVVVGGHADKLLEIIAQARRQTRVRTHRLAARDRELEQVAGGEETGAVTDADLGSILVAGDVLTHARTLHVQGLRGITHRTIVA